MKAVLGVLPFLLLAACQGTGDSTRAYLQTDIFEDIPAPRGSVYLDRKKESFSYRRETFRCGKFMYDWSGADAEVVRFYKETMTAPPYSWTLMEESAPATGSTRLVFVKGEDRCSVEVDRVPRPQRQDNVAIVVRVNYRR